jgi:hypothetical protein
MEQSWLNNVRTTQTVPGAELSAFYYIQVFPISTPSSGGSV